MTNGNDYAFTRDYKAEFKAYVDDLYASGIVGIDEKNEAIRAIKDAYVAQTEERPEPAQLDRLATWLLKGEHIDAGFESTDQERHRLRNNREIYVPTVYNDELSMKHDGNRVVKPNLNPLDSDDTYGEHVLTEYDFAKDRRKYNAPLRKNTKT